MPTRAPSTIDWRDLTALSSGQRWRELMLPLPFLVAAVSAGMWRCWWLFPVCYAYFFLSGLRLVHDLFHGNLGLSRPVTRALLLMLSAAMLGSMHAVRVTHLAHHRDCLGPGDVEGRTALGSAWRALVAGPCFTANLHRAALTAGTLRERRWILAELALTGAMILAALGGPSWLRLHVASMGGAHLLVGFFAVWTVHHDLSPDVAVARTVRHPVKSALVLGMFFHHEHHLFPRVPTCRLSELARRLDRGEPVRARVPVY